MEKIYLDEYNIIKHGITLNNSFDFDYLIMKISIIVQMFAMMSLTNTIYCQITTFSSRNTLNSQTNFTTHSSTYQKRLEKMKLKQVFKNTITSFGPDTVS